MVRDGKWKIIHFFEDGNTELYNQAQDPGEKMDMVSTRPDIVEKLWADLEAWRLEVGGQVPAVNRRWEAMEL